MDSTPTRTADSPSPPTADTSANVQPEHHLGANIQPQHQPEHNHPPEVHIWADIRANTSSPTDKTYMRPVGPRRWIFRGCDWRIFARSAPERSPSSDSAMSCAAGGCNSSRGLSKRKPRFSQVRMLFKN